ncbi:MAG: hypothetical protein KIT81_08150 [Alphaproteobacteria bacterium]|nr:hypothetical protein [Alphaproteobacteria bacterium]
MSGMGMMTPEMGQRMRSQGGMPGMMGGMQGRGMPEGGMDRGMVGRMPMMGGMVMCPMMGVMASDHGGMGMPGTMGFHGLLFGTPPGKPEEMTQERVRALLTQHLAALGNPRLKIGEIGASAEGNITAEIVTVDGSLVQKLAFNRYPGLVRRVD